MKKSKVVIAALAASVLTVSALGLAACTKKGSGDDNKKPDNTPNNTTTGVYTITFDANEGKFAEDKTTTTLKTTDGKISALPTAPTRADYTFSKWTVNKDGTGDEVTATYAFTKDTTVYAQWTAATPDDDDDDDNDNDNDRGLDKVTCDGTSGYVVGKFEGDDEFDWDNGVEMTYNADGANGDGEWSITIELREGEVFKMRVGGNGYGFNTIEGSATAKANFEEDTSDDQHNIIVKTGGSYTFYVKPTWESNNIWIEVA